VLGEEAHAFVAAGFDEGGDEEGVEEAIGFVFADVLVKFCAVGWGREGLEGDVAGFEELVDLFEVGEFFLGDGCEGADEAVVGGVAEHEVEGDACGFAFAVGVVEEDGGQVREGLINPFL
jgi:hypothetical protein